MSAVKGAEREVSLVALYLGTGEKERRIILGLEQALRRNPKLRVRLLFDGRRCVYEVML